MNQIRIMSKNRLFPVAEDLYGLFYEDINRAGDSGIYPGDAAATVLLRILLSRRAVRSVKRPGNLLRQPAGWENFMEAKD